MADEMIPMEVDQENQLAIVIVDQPAETAEPRFYEGTMFGLPREWTAEIRPRKTSSKYRGKVDQFFYEPGTRRQFRSLKAVKKHLGLDVGQTSRKRKPNPSKAAGQTESHNEKEKSASKAAGQFKDKVGASNKIAEEHKEEEHHHYFDKVANKIRWQLVNSEQNRWNKYVKVPNAVQEQWMGIFLKPQSYRKANHQG